MVLESTMFCIDNSDFMRNGDFDPTRLESQLGAVSLLCKSKQASNPENNVGLISMANTNVLVTLTTDFNLIHSKLSKVQPSGSILFVTAIRIAQLALKHRQGRNHHMRIVIFVGSPVIDDEKDIVGLGKKLRKDNVSVDIVNFGEEEENTDKLTTFINTINGNDANGSHLLSVPSGSDLSGALISSQMVDTDKIIHILDPYFDYPLFDLISVHRSLNIDKPIVPSIPDDIINTDDIMIQNAIKMSLENSEVVQPDLNEMTEEEQLEYAIRLSLQSEKKSVIDSDLCDDYTDVMEDPEFLQSVFNSLDGVDSESEAICSAIQSLTKGNKKEDKKEGGNERK